MTKKEMIDKLTNDAVGHHWQCSIALQRRDKKNYKYHLRKGTACLRKVNVLLKKD